MGGGYVCRRNGCVSDCPFPGVERNKREESGERNQERGIRREESGECKKGKTVYTLLRLRLCPVC